MKMNAETLSPASERWWSPQPERSASRRRVAEREAVGVGPHGTDGCPQPERSASRSGVAGIEQREAVGVEPRGGERYPDRPKELRASRPSVEVETLDSRTAFVALLVFTFIMLLAPQNVFPVLKPFRIAFLTGLLAIAAHLWHRMLYRQPLTRLTHHMVICMVLAGWALVMVPISYWPGGSLNLLLDQYLKAFVLFWLLSNIVNTRERMIRTCWTLSILSIPLALVGLRHFVSGVVAPTLDARIIGYDAALTRNPNDLALMLNLLLPISVGLLGSARSGVARAVLGCAIVLDIIAIVITFSRAGFLTLVLSGLLFLRRFLRTQKWGAVAALLALGVAGIPFLPRSYVERLATITDAESDPTGSSQVRLRDSVAAVEYVLDHPIVGAGPGMNILALNEVRGDEWKAVHNAYLEYAVDLGLPGLVLYLLLTLSCFRTVNRVRKRTEGRPDLRDLHQITQGIQISLAAFSLAACFHPVAYQFPFFYIAGLSLAAQAAYEACEAGTT